MEASVKLRAADRPTQGNWWYEHEEPNWSAQARVLTRVPGCGNSNILIAHLGQQRETRHNGHLIAASKDLRRALIRLLKVTLDHVEACDDWRALGGAQRTAFEALNKASGKKRNSKPEPDMRHKRAMQESQEYAKALKALEEGDA